MSEDTKKSLLVAVDDYGDLKFRAGVAYSLGDRETGRLREAGAKKALEKIRQLLTKPEKGK